MNSQRIVFNRIAVTGPDKAPAFLNLEDGLNIIWGQSNTGKSFVRKAIDYLLGGEKPPLPPEAEGFDNYIGWITTPLSGKVTLRRSALTSEIYKADGHLDHVDTNSPNYEVLKVKHSVSNTNISKFILSEVGFHRNHVLLKNERAEKIPFSLRVLARYLIVDETRMIDEKSVLLGRHDTTLTAADRGLIRLVLTGIDGSSVEQVMTPDQMKASRDGKIALLADMSEELRAAIDENVSDDAVQSLLNSAQAKVDNLSAVLAERQSSLSLATQRLREREETIVNLENSKADIQVMILRFEELQRVYQSDVERLKGLEEGGFLLEKFARMMCPVCGAAPDDQKHDHGLAGIETQSRAALAEIAKIEAESRDLAEAIDVARSEITTFNTNLEKQKADRIGELADLDKARKSEGDARTVFLTESKEAKRLEADLDKRLRLEKMQSRSAALEALVIRSRNKATGVDINFSLTSPEGHAITNVVKDVLKAWNYPGGNAVHYVPALGDIQIDGKDRKDNGAGVRAVLHSAFKVAVLIYCQANNRPHPGFLILDSPLMAFTDNLENSNEEDQALIQASVATNFYKHLESLKGSAQIIVIENHKDSASIPEQFHNIHFTKGFTPGRIGFFPNTKAVLQ